jgi:hypothetical protein
LTDARQIGADARANSVDTMTRQASALALEDRLPTRGIASHRPAGLGRGERAEVRDDALGLLVGHVRRRHGRPGHALADDRNEILVGLRGLELTAPEIDAGNLIAVRTVAIGAALSEDASAIFDVRSCLVLGGRL